MNNDPCWFSPRVFDEAYWQLYYYWALGDRPLYNEFYRLCCLTQREQYERDYYLPPEIL